MALMSERVLPSREDIGQWLDDWARSGEVGWYEMFSDTLRAVASGRLVDREGMIPMYRQGGLSTAWYPTQGVEDEPDGYLFVSGDV